MTSILIFTILVFHLYIEINSRPSFFNEAKGKWENGTKNKTVDNLGSQKGMFQGDIVGFPLNGKLRNGIKFQIQQWPNGLIPYAFASSFSPSQVTNIANAMLVIQSNTCIRFTPWLNQKDYIYFENTNTGCNSRIGRFGGSQRISLQRGMQFDFCLQQASVTHELLHAIGLWHEQSRSDRDSYLTINLNNVNTKEWINFDKLNTFNSNTYGTPYDYRSIMHYGKNAAAINPFINVMITKDQSMQDVIGTAEIPSYWDFYKVNKIYNCQYDNRGQSVSVTKCADYANDCGSLSELCDSNSYIKLLCPVTCYLC